MNEGLLLLTLHIRNVTPVSTSTRYQITIKPNGTTTGVPRNTSDSARLGVYSMLTLAVSVIVIFGVLGFLIFLWFAPQTNKTWKLIMINIWATRAISISGMLLRTAADFQAAIAAAMLASLLLESRHGLTLYQLATLSSLRSSATNPYGVALSVFAELRSLGSTFKRKLFWGMATACLLATTGILQFSSTILLSDLQIGPLAGNTQDAKIKTGFTYRCSDPECTQPLANKIPRDASWTTNPASYPAFGELSLPSTEIEEQPRSRKVSPILGYFCVHSFLMRIPRPENSYTVMPAKPWS
jgi:hypothetical protein